VVLVALLLVQSIAVLVTVELVARGRFVTRQVGHSIMSS